MPRLDRTGPMAYGPKTGRGLGHCTGNRRPDNVNQQMPGRGFGRGFDRRRGSAGGMGRGRRARRGAFCVQSNPEEERRSLESHRETLQSQLNDVNKRIEELAAQET